jgi:hypothetical protein
VFCPNTIWLSIHQNLFSPARLKKTSSRFACKSFGSKNITIYLKKAKVDYVTGMGMMKESGFRIYAGVKLAQEIFHPEIRGNK